MPGPCALAEKGPWGLQLLLQGGLGKSEYEVPRPSSGAGDLRGSDLLHQVKAEELAEGLNSPSTCLPKRSASSQSHLSSFFRFHSLVLKNGFIPLECWGSK